MMVELDDIHCDQRRLAKGKPRPRTKRVNLACQNLSLLAVTIFPCMVDPAWYDAHCASTLLEEELEMYEEDPEGFREKAPPEAATSSMANSVDPPNVVGSSLNNHAGNSE
jgi:hypothetical protein